MMAIRAATWFCAVLTLVTGLAQPVSAGLAEPFPITTENLLVVGMAPTEIVEYDSLLLEYPTPIAAVMAKAVTTSGATVLDEILKTKYSVGIYQYNAHLHRWMPMWERVTGEMSIAFVEGYDILDLTGDGMPELAVRIRYSGPERVLDYVVKSVENGQVTDVFQRRSLYQGRVTATTGAIVFHSPVVENGEDFDRQETYSWNPKLRLFEKTREIRNKVP